jgi:Protein of unknown function (DUF2637)
VSKQHDLYKLLTTAAVLVVASCAAVVSYLHIETLALRYGQPKVAAYLIPVLTDGAVAVASLVMFRSARIGQTNPWLARSLLLLAVVATLACNVGYGIRHGWPGALISGWPAIAFVGSAEVAINLSGRKKMQAKTAATASAATSVPVHGETNGQVYPARVAKLRAQEVAAAAALATNPDLTHAELAKSIGTSERTARRVRDRLATSEAAA